MDSAFCSQFSQTLNLPCAEATSALGVALSKIVQPGDCLTLTGPIGAGKSHLARALIQTLLAKHGAVEDVPSPTYTLVQVYQAGNLEIWHADLYRVSDATEIEELGLTEAMDHALCLVEWPERAALAYPDQTLHITLRPSTDGLSRTAMLSGQAEHWAKRLPLLPEVNPL